MNKEQSPFFVSWLHKLDQFMVWWITNIQIYLRLCYKVYTKRGPKLFRRLARWNQNGISPTLFFVFNVVIMTLLPLTRDIPNATDVGIDYRQQLLNINSHSASVVSVFLEYTLGTIVFAFLVTKFLRLRGIKPFWHTWRILCYASAWFWPIFLIAAIYNNLGYSIFRLVDDLLWSDFTERNLTGYVIACVLVSFLFWGIVKYRWLKFIFNQLDFSAQPKKRNIALFLGCFLFVNYSLTFVIVFLQSEKVILNSLYERQYEYAMKQEDDDNILFYGSRLGELNYLPKRARYHILITNFVICMENLDIPGIDRLYSLALDRKYSELEEALIVYLETDPRAYHFFPAENLKNIQMKLLDDPATNKDPMFMVDFSFWFLTQLRLTPYDENIVLNTIPYICACISYRDELWDN